MPAYNKPRWNIYISTNFVSSENDESFPVPLYMQSHASASALQIYKKLLLTVFQY